MAKRERYKLHMGVLLILKKGSKILFLKRATTGWLDNYYSLPAGGLDPNETLATAVIREAEEEVGVRVKASDLKLVNTMHCNDDKEQWINVTFVAEKWTGEPKVCDPHKHSEVKWIDVNKLPDS